MKSFKGLSRDWLMAGTVIPMLAGPAAGIAAPLPSSPIVLAQAGQPGDDQHRPRPPGEQNGHHDQPQQQQQAPRPAPQAPAPRPAPEAPQPHPAPAPQAAPRPAPAPAPAASPRPQPAPQPQVQRPAAPAPQPPQHGVQPVSPMTGNRPLPAPVPPPLSREQLNLQQTSPAQLQHGVQPAPPVISRPVPVQGNAPGQPQGGRPPMPAPMPPAGAQPQPVQPGNGNRPPMPVQGAAPGQPQAGRPAFSAPPPPPPPPPPPGAQQQGRPPLPGQPNQGGQQRGGNGNAAIVGAAAGFVGGFLAAQGFEHLDQVRGQRQTFTSDGVEVIREPGHTIIEQDNQYFIAHDENERFRDLGYDVQSQRQGGYEVDAYDAPDGSRVFSYTDGQGRLVRRLRRFPDGREIVLIDNRYTTYDRAFAQDVVVLPPPPLQLPPDRYEVDASRADEGLVYDTLIAPPVAPLPRQYTLDQIRYSPDLRAHMRSVDLNAITFDTGSWTVSADQAARLAGIARAIIQAVQRNPQEIFMVEGYTDAVGTPVDNLSLSDRRAQSVAAILTRNFQVPPENLVTQGYGQQYLKVQTQGASVENRRVAVRRITPLLAQQH
jgi:outer membrane protein OmpA-like peptidoglycan-associated protein